MTGANRRRLSAGVILVLVGSVGLTVTGQAPQSNKYDTWLMNGAAGSDSGAMTSRLRSDRPNWEDWYQNAGMSFLSGANYHAALTKTGDAHVGASASPAAVLAAIELYCGSHPLDKIGSALVDVYSQLVTH